MGVIGRSCQVCGARTTGAAKCEAHAAGGGQRRRPCITCGRPTQGLDYCPDHAGDGAPDWRAVYDNVQWRRTRDEAKRLARGLCARCGLGGVPLQADHVKPVVEGGAPYDQLNVQMLCRGCHHLKTAEDRARRARNLSLVCTYCGNDDSTEGYPYCTDCLQLLAP